MRDCIIGRKTEKKELDKIFNSSKAEFLAVCGRRRVGKTFLIKEYFEKELVFSVSGLAKANTPKQIKNFYSTLKLYDASLNEKPNDWLDAFNLLIKYLTSLPQERKVILLDELPWMDTQKSGFISALEHFWNGWASSRRDIVLIVCGSATSWMMDNLINNHGGLHNRLTRQMFLEPFTLNETEQMLESLGFNLSRYEIAEYYMILGGIPYYMTLLNPEESVAQNIDRLIFKRNGELTNEFDNLYAALFKNSENYIKVASVLNSKRSGLTRNEIKEETKLPSGGTLTKILKNMESCGFIRKYKCLSLGKTQTVYQLVDFFSLFYFRFMQHETGNKANYWSAIQGIPYVSVSVRRLHDIGASGWWITAGILSYAVPFAPLLVPAVREDLGLFISCYFALCLVPIGIACRIIISHFQDTQRGGNSYGPSSKYPRA